MKRILLILLGVLVAIPLLFVMVVLFYPRPENLTPAHVYQGDAHAIDYCDLPVLDGSGLMADDIPQGHTPGCGYEKFPMPILAGCTEPPDLYSDFGHDRMGRWTAAVLRAGTRARRGTVHGGRGLQMGLSQFRHDYNETNLQVA